MLERHQSSRFATPVQMLIPVVPPAPEISDQQLERAAEIRKKIDALREQLARVLGMPGKGEQAGMG